MNCVFVCVCVCLGVFVCYVICVLGSWLDSIMVLNIPEILIEPSVYGVCVYLGLVCVV